ncbi:hypothetical protein LB519_15055 [Mesorhizobium sp. AD1-1]|uniref:hypothetical protein n=1 Tax=Mesorhizobium sp. AD1-1 TaxID=2876621 RepID=UPI001CCE6285|nr:hypothetical protein [Mesorhizobium sp. AD1-1]MBZ9719164.1 hypothetical protein [Mesorhizobium sp. AD1-1]
MTGDVPASGTFSDPYIGQEGCDTILVTIKGHDGIVPFIDGNHLEPGFTERVFDIQEDKALILHDQDGT